MRDRPGGGPAITTLALLRSFELRNNDQRVVLAPGARRLVAFLALQGRMLERVYVAGMLWIDYSQDAANANLRTTLWRLRRLSHPLVEATASHLCLAPEVIVDLPAAMAITRQVAGGGVCREADLDDLIAAGDLLPDWYDDWVVIERERFRQGRLHALEAFCDVLTREGRYGKAIEVGLTAVAAEPLRESAHRAVMRVHLAEGNRCEALRQYALCRDLLAGLGLKPAADTERLRQQCASGDDLVTHAG